MKCWSAVLSRLWPITRLLPCTRVDGALSAAQTVHEGKSCGARPGSLVSSECGLCRDCSVQQKSNAAGSLDVGLGGCKRGG